MYDNHVRDLVWKNPNSAVPWFLMAGYSYDHVHEHLINDETWQWLCKFIDDNWEVIRHRHKWLIERDTLSTGSTFYLKLDDYPGMVIGTAQGLIREMHNAQSEQRSEQQRKRRERRARR